MDTTTTRRTTRSVWGQAAGKTNYDRLLAKAPFTFDAIFGVEADWDRELSDFEVQAIYKYRDERFPLRALGIAGY